MTLNARDRCGAGLYYYRARYYSPKLGRFLQTDPVGAKDDLNLYTYTYNNPANAIDPTGAEVAFADPAEKTQIEGLINARALGQFAFDDNGRLKLTSAAGDTSKYSAYYQSRLVAAINDDDLITIDISQTFESSTGESLDVDKFAAGGVTQMDSTGSSRVTISGNDYFGLVDETGSYLRDEAADILGHELLGHAIPRAVGPDTGNAIENENKMRSEVKGGGRRAPDPEHSECGRVPCPK